jgi:hypothetical protein
VASKKTLLHISFNIRWVLYLLGTTL